MTFMQLKEWTTEAIHNDPGVRIAVDTYCLNLLPKLYEELYKCSFLYRFMRYYLTNLPPAYGKAPDQEREIKAFFRKYWDDENEEGVENDYRAVVEIYSLLSEADMKSDETLARKIGSEFLARARRVAKHFFSLYMKGGRAMRLIASEAGVSEAEADAELGTKSDYDFNLVVNPSLDPNVTFELMKQLYEKMDLFLQTKTQDPFFEDDTLNRRIEIAITNRLRGKEIGGYPITGVELHRIPNFGFYSSNVTDEEFVRESLFKKPFFLIRLGTVHDVGITTTRGPYRAKADGYYGSPAVGELIDISFVLRGGDDEAEFDWKCAKGAELIARPESTLVPDLLEVYDLHSILADLEHTLASQRRQGQEGTAKYAKRVRRIAFFEKLLCFSKYGKDYLSEKDWPTCKRILRTFLCGAANLTESEQDLLVQETIGIRLESLTIFDLLYAFHEKWFRASHTKRVVSAGVAERTYFYFDSANPADAHHAAFVRFAATLRERLLSLRAMDVESECCRYYINLVKMLDKGAFNDEQMRRFIIASSAYNIISYVDEMRGKRPAEISPDRLTLRLNRAAHDRYEARNAEVSQPIVNSMGRPLMKYLLERLPDRPMQLIVVGGYAYELWQNVLKCCPKEQIGQKLLQYIKAPGKTPFATNDIDLRLTVGDDQFINVLGAELAEFARRSPLPPDAPNGAGYEVIRFGPENPGLLQVLYTSRSPLTLPGTDELMWERSPIFRGLDVLHLVEIRCEPGVYTDREVIVAATDKRLTFGILQLKELLNRFQQVVTEEHQPIRLKKYVDRIVALSKAETRIVDDMCVYSGARKRTSTKRSPKRSPKRKSQKSKRSPGKSKRSPKRR
jgi:hypothetical protein